MVGAVVDGGDDEGTVVLGVGAVVVEVTGTTEVDVDAGGDVVVVDDEVDVGSGRHGPVGVSSAGGSFGIVTRGAQPKL